MTWAFLDRAAEADRTAERRALELRAQELSARALVPGSPLACLDTVAGENVAAAYERALFVSPASVAAASSYVAERLALLAAMVAYVERGGTDIEVMIEYLCAQICTHPTGIMQEREGLATMLVLPIGDRRVDVALLLLLRSACQQDKQCLSVAREIEPVARPKIDLVFQHAPPTDFTLTRLPCSIRVITRLPWRALPGPNQQIIQQTVGGHPRSRNNGFRA
jgi:hypothetical protein